MVNHMLKVYPLADVLSQKWFWIIHLTLYMTLLVEGEHILLHFNIYNINTLTLLEAIMTSLNIPKVLRYCSVHFSCKAQNK